MSSNLVKHIKYRHKEAFQEYLAENPQAGEVFQGLDDAAGEDHEDLLLESQVEQFLDVDMDDDDDIEFVGLEQNIKQERFNDEFVDTKQEYIDYQEICENLKRRQEEQINGQLPSGAAVPKTSQRPPIVIQSDGTVFVSCADGTNIRIENNSVNITTSENRKILVEKEEVSFASDACRVDIKKIGVRVRTKEIDTMMKFVRN